MSKIFKLTDKKSVLKKRLHYPLETEKHSVALIQFYTTYLTHNITPVKNRLYFINLGDMELSVEIPVGQYSLKDLVKTIKTISPFDIVPMGGGENNSIFLELDKIINRVKVKCVFDLQFGKWGSIGELLGFTENKILKANEYHYGDTIPKFVPFETLNIHCNVANGMILKHDEYNHRETSIIATFKPRTTYGFGDTIYYEPAYPLFFPVQTHQVNEIIVEIKDGKGKLINFDLSERTVVLEMRP